MTVMIKANPQLPAAIAKLTALAVAGGKGIADEFSGGVVAGFPILGYKGKVWRIRKGGEETIHMDANKNAIPSVDLVLVAGNPNLSKIYYDKPFEDGTNEAPRCFSNDGTKPDASVKDPISKLCVNCPNNVWGSRTTDQGKKARACSDARRMAVVFAADLLANGKDCTKYLLRVPPASLNPVKDYVEKTLAPKGIPAFAVVTTIGFDVHAAHPQFTLKASRFLNDDEANAIVELRESEDVKRILAESEFSTAAAGDEATDNSPAPATAVGSATPGASASTTAAVGGQKKLRPADDEEAGIAAAPPSKAAAPVEGEIMPPATPPKKKKAAAPAPVPAPAPVVAADVDEEEEAPAPAVNHGVAAPAGFDAMLDSILNG